MFMKMKSAAPSWHRLDNAANVFPLISHKNFSNVFRVAVQLNFLIQVDRLETALKMTLNDFGNFNFRIRRGIFWYYFEPSKVVPLVEEEHLRPCAFIDPKGKNGLFRVYYYKNRINLEVFHALTDGTGAVNFLKALTVNYLDLLEGGPLVIDQPLLKVQAELEDSYKKHYRNMPTKDQRLPRAFRLKGDRLPINTIGIIHGHLELDAVLKVCKSKGVSLTVYIASVYLWSVYHAYVEDKSIKKPIQMAVPVNLRQFFDSKTNMNFFSHITLSILERNEILTFEEILEQIKVQFKNQVTKENMLKNISKDVLLRRKPYIRVLPLPLKNLFVKLIHINSVQSYTTTMSNIGKITLPEKYHDAISHFEFVVNASAVDPMKCGICAYNNHLVLTLSSQLSENLIEKHFFRKLAEEGLVVKLESNGAYYETL